MNKYIGYVFFLMFFGGFVSAQNLPRVTVVNNTGYTIYSMYIVQSETDDGTEDFLQGRVLNNENSYQVRLRYPLNVKNMCQIRLIDENGNFYEKFHISLKSDTRIVFTRDDFYGDILPPFEWADDIDIGPPPPIPPGW
jgi:hypothetical protein